jgi:hypothetical protein
VGIVWRAYGRGVRARGGAVVPLWVPTLAAVSERVAGAPPRPVFVAEWLDPPYVAGHWIPEMVALAGGREVLAQAGAPSYPTTWEEVRQQGPELVVVAPCGFDHERAAREASLPPLGCRAVAVDSNAYYARPAPRVADGVAQLAFPDPPRTCRRPGAPVRRACAPSSEGHGHGTTLGEEQAVRPATDLGRCLYDIPELGDEIHDVWYDDGLAALAEEGASFLDYTARNSAYARRRVPLEHDLNARGNWVAAEIAFGLPGLDHPLLVLGPGPVYANPRHARRAYEDGRELDLRQPALELPAEMRQWGDSWDGALTRLCRADREQLARGQARPSELRVLELPHAENFFIESEELAALDDDVLEDARLSAREVPLCCHLQSLRVHPSPA